MNETINAFDAVAIHAGNKGREIDHASVAPRVELLLAGMTLAQKINEIRGRQTQSIEGLYYAGANPSYSRLRRRND